MKQSMRLVERDLEILNELVYACDAERNGIRREAGVAPIDLGGGNGSDHSYRLTKMARHGYVEHKMRGHEWGDVTTRDARGSKLYRPTDAGRAIVANWRAAERAKRNAEQ